jgi:hypothetical protein
MAALDDVGGGCQADGAGPITTVGGTAVCAFAMTPLFLSTSVVPDLQRWRLSWVQETVRKARTD